MNKVYVGDAGTVIVLNCGQDVSNAITRTVEALRPDGTSVSWAATANGTTAIQTTLGANELTVAGAWRLQAKVVTPSGTWHGATVVMQVYPRQK